MSNNNTGLFGLFHGIGTLTKTIVESAKESDENLYLKKVAINIGSDTYSDARGKQRLISNNHPCAVFPKDGYYWLYDLKTDKYVKRLGLTPENQYKFDLEQRKQYALDRNKKSREKAIIEGRLWYQGSIPDDKCYSYNGCRNLSYIRTSNNKEIKYGNYRPNVINLFVDAKYEELHVCFESPEIIKQEYIVMKSIQSNLFCYENPKQKLLEERGITVEQYRQYFIDNDIYLNMEDFKRVHNIKE